MNLRWTSLAMVALVGCADPVLDVPPAAEMSEQPDEMSEEACPTPEWDGIFEVGYGDMCFSPVADGLTVPLIAGRQGGYHVWLGVRCRDCGFFENVQYGLRDAQTGAELAPLQGNVLQLDDAGAYTQAHGLTALVDVGGPDGPESAQSMVGRTVVLFAQVELGPDVVTSEAEVTIDQVVAGTSCPQCN